MNTQRSARIAPHAAKIFLAEDFTSTRARQRRVTDGLIMPLARGVWTDAVGGEPEEIVAAKWREIVGRLLPTAVISERSGFVLRPIGGELFVSHPRAAPLELPGLTVYPDGKKNHRRADDQPLDLQGHLFASSPARALIDNAEQRGRPGAVRRRLTREELHDQVVRLVTTSTRSQVDNILEVVDRDVNRVAAASIEVFVEAARGERNTVDTTSRAMKAAQRRETYDVQRVARFRQIAEHLSRQKLVQRYVEDVSRMKYVAFYEAYFSNYIEGSTLTVDEAARAVFAGEDVGKPEDAHDMRGTWQIVSDETEMRHVPADAAEFMDMLRDRHRVVMAGRPDKLPGMWKQGANRAGMTTFVDPDQVPGTLRAGWEEGQILTDPFLRAAYMMFLVSEVHPFADGNGRSARIAMNGELVAAGQHRIIIPTVLRTDYLSALTRATADHGPEGLHRVLEHAQRWVSVGDFSTMKDGSRYCLVTDAMYEAGVAERRGKYLRILRPGEIDELPVPTFEEMSEESDTASSWLEIASDSADQEDLPGSPLGQEDRRHGDQDHQVII
jgi:hypothetical protein